MTRLERLPRAAVAMARAVAVLGDGADFDHAASLAQLDGDEAFEAVLALHGADVLRTNPGLAFVHPVVQAAVEGDLAPLERSVERAETELLATGARARRLLLRGVEALTASERRVAGLAAQGATNREIAQSLFVTTKTVEVHLTSAYRKLDITSRVQLPGALAA